MPWYTEPSLQNCRHIIIKDICRDMMIGAYEHEKLAPQPVILNIELFVRTNCEGDRLENAYNYDEVIQAVDSVIERGHIQLQETLVDSIADGLLKNPMVYAVLVKSEKTGAYEQVKSAGVEIFKVHHG